MNCPEIETQLDAYLDDTLAPEALSRVQAHVATCADCKRAVDRARAIRRALAAYPVSDPRADFTDRALKHASLPSRSILPGRLVAAAFVGTLMLSVVTVIMTGLSVKAPRTQIVAALPTVTMQLDTARVVNLVFESRSPLDAVTLLVTLPPGVELDGYPGQVQVEWRTALAAGKNVLPLALIAHDGAGGQLIAQLGSGELRKVFRVHLDIGAG